MDARNGLSSSSQVVQRVGARRRHPLVVAEPGLGSAVPEPRAEAGGKGSSTLLGPPPSLPDLAVRRSGDDAHGARDEGGSRSGGRRRDAGEERAGSERERDERQQREELHPPAPAPDEAAAPHGIWNGAAACRVVAVFRLVLEGEERKRKGKGAREAR